MPATSPNPNRMSQPAAFQIYSSQPELNLDHYPYCTSCLLIWRGRISLEESWLEQVTAKTVQAKKSGKPWVIITEPPMTEWGLMVWPAVTVGPSWVFPPDQGFPHMPVCLSHLAGYAPLEYDEGTTAFRSPLVAAKKGQRQ